MHRHALPPLIVLGFLAVAGCAVMPPEAPPPVCGESPHSRFHPVPTKPVFEGSVTAFADAPVTTAPAIEIPPELLAPPEDGEPQLLPEISSKPISFDRPSSRRRQ